MPAVGSNEQHDPNDIENDGPDPGNPNANTPPAAPTSAGQASGQLAVTVSNAQPSADLGTNVTIDVTVEPKAGFTGDADLSVSGLPDGATATFAPAKVTLGTTSVTSKLTIAVPVTTVASAQNSSSALVISAKSGTTAATANANFKVNPKLLLTIPMNIDALRAASGTKYIDQWGAAFGATQQPLHTQDGNGIVVSVKNGDSTAHIVHGANGFAHGDQANPIPPNSMELLQDGTPRTRTLNVGTNCNGYPHEGQNGSSASFRIKVETAP
ncbi:hypothetical protein AKJ09_10123 [Labilithrix luteola]|uniref:Uncharacterized protein n=1 Tax=Labilithrix luteola TaxID=1391654 RepID=A0A0K1QDF1_9BACT|nr:hypothetical protein AKJ09_10123 [Labilithrix luteola]